MKTYTITVNFSNRKRAKNFTRFVNRHGGKAAQSGSQVTIEDTNPSQIRSWFAKSGYIGDCVEITQSETWSWFD